jgi:ferritin
MMISKKMVKAINEQVAAEWGSYYIYLAMSYKLKAMSLPILSQWFYMQAGEEMMHAEKMANYILDQDGEVELLTIPAPKANWKKVADICKETVAHEILITNRIHDLVTLADKEKDFATRSFLQWFVDEQVEEVATAKELQDIVKMSEPSGQMLMLENRVQQLVAARTAASA